MAIRAEAIAISLEAIGMAIRAEAIATLHGY